MIKRLAFAAVIAATIPMQAHAAASVSFTLNSTSLPAYALANNVPIVQEFTGSVPPGNFLQFTTTAFPAASGYSQSVTTSNQGGSVVVRNNNGHTNGTYLDIFASLPQGANANSPTFESYTLTDNNPRGLQFVAFVLSNFVSTALNEVTLTYTDGSQSGNILSQLVTAGSISAGQSGEVVIDQGGAIGISAITFTSRQIVGGIDNTNRLLIDSIAVAAPEPATWGMMLLGFGIVG